MIASAIAILVVFGIWSVYTMVTTWSAKILPRIEAQRIARITMKTIVEGKERSDGAGVDIIAGKSYRRRDGIASAIAMPTITSDADIEKITYNLDGLSNQSFFILKGENPKRLYRNSSSSPVKGTEGITDLSFQLIGSNMLRVTATVERDISVDTHTPDHTKAELVETVVIRNT